MLDAALQAGAEAGLPPHEVSALQGSLLALLARLRGARRILELGTLGGYSTIWLARTLPAGGRLVTLERDAHRADVARTAIAAAGLGDVVELRVGPALETLPELAAEGAEAFDMVFVDADKAANPEYLHWALALGAPGTLIVADNVVRGGTVLDPPAGDAAARGARRFLELLAAEPRVSATVVQTVGAKGHDGFALALINADDGERPA